MKLDIGTKEGKTYHYELSDEKILAFIGKKIGDIIDGNEIDSAFAGYQFEITGLSDIRGFPGLKGVKGAGIKRVLLSYGKGMRQRRPKGLRKKKSVHGEEIDRDVVQINLKVIKEGSRKLDEIVKRKEE